MPDFETRLTALGAARKELEDAFIVMTHLETRQSQALREQAEYVASHEKRLQEAEERDARLRERNQDIDARIEKLVSAIGALIPRQKPQ